MGNGHSEKIHHAIKQDGEENVKNAAILTANQKFIDNYVQEIKPKLENSLKINEQLKLSQVYGSRDIVEQLFQNKKIELETQETGTVEFLTTKHHKSFEDLSCYAEAVSRIDDFETRVKEIYGTENKKMLEDIEKYKEDLKFEMEKLKQPLPALMAFGVEEKEQILEEAAKNYQEEIEKSNKKLEEDLKFEFEFEELHRKRVEEWVPSSELNEILADFEKSLSNLHSTKSNFFSCY